MSAFHFQADPLESSGRGHVVVPADMKDKAQLLVFLQRALALPDYFGQNWDALEECLLDFERLKREPVILVNQDIPLHGKPEDQRLYLQILASAALVSDRLQVIFPDRCRREIEKILQER